MPVLEVEYFDRFNRFRDFLSVSAHVLHGRAADTSWNAAQAFDPGAVGSDRMGDEAVPGLAGTGIEQNFSLVLAGTLLDSGDGNFQDNSRPSGIGHDEIASASQNKEWEISRSREGNPFAHFFRRLGFDQEACRPSDAEGGQRRERNVFLEKHEIRFDYTTAREGVACSFRRRVSTRENSLGQRYSQQIGIFRLRCRSP